MKKPTSYEQSQGCERHFDYNERDSKLYQHHRLEHSSTAYWKALMFIGTVGTIGSLFWYIIIQGCLLFYHLVF